MSESLQGFEDSSVSIKLRLITERVARILSFIGEPYSYAVLSVFFAVYSSLLGGALLALLVLTEALNFIIKKTIKRERPLNGAGRRHDAKARGYSFPSCHAQNAAAIYGFLLLNVAVPGVQILAAALLIAICWSRLRLRSHFATDVLAGAALGALTALAATAVIPFDPVGIG